MTLLKNSVAYVRARPGLPADVQRELAREAGVDVIYEHGEHKRLDMRAEWIKGLGTGRDRTAWVARLDVLLMPKADLASGKPSRDFATALTIATGKAARLIEGTTGIASDGDSAAWSRRVSWAMQRATGGTTRDIEAQRAHGKRGGAIVKSRSVVARWKSTPWKEKLRAASVIWRDPECHNWQDAAKRLPDELRTLSFTSLWRLLGPRRPNDPKAGGRPSKVKRGKAPRTRYVYFIRRGNKREVKIGSAYNVPMRFGTLKTSSPDDLRLIGVIAGDDKTERKMHTKFKTYWIRREWFKLEGELAEFVKQLPKIETT